MTFYPSITSTGYNWKQTIAEADSLGITAVCFFPTCLAPAERQTAYQLLAKTKITYIPLVHLRSDMAPEEIEFFMDRYHTEHFNLHSLQDYSLTYDLKKFYPQIYLETGKYPIDGELNNFAGVCADFTHIENFRLVGDERHKIFIDVLGRYKCGVAHISAIGKIDDGHYDRHDFSDIKEFDYLSRYMDFLPEICALELENTLKEQLTVQKYLQRIIGI